MVAVSASQAARRDLIEIYVYLAEKAGQDAADKFLASAEASFARLAAHPEIGSPLKMRHPELAGLRKWKLKGFDNVLIFYLSRPEGVLIVRVLHAAQNWWGLLGIQT